MTTQTPKQMGPLECGREIVCHDRRFPVDQQGELTIAAVDLEQLPRELQQILLLRHGSSWNLAHATQARLRRLIGASIDEEAGGLANGEEAAASPPVREAAQAHRHYVGRQALLATGAAYYVRGFGGEVTADELRERLAREAFVLEVWLPKASGSPYARVVFELRSGQALMERLRSVQLTLRNKPLRFSPAPPRPLRIG